MEYRDAQDWLYSTQLFGIKLGLDPMRRLCDALQIDTAAPRIIHVAGTNGKGSTCAFAESAARSAGERTGLFTSPHLVSFTERIQVNRVNANQAHLAELLTQIRETVKNWDPHPTFFELATALALRHFQDESCTTILLETGMGGRLDATNVVTPAVAALTPIGLDHQQWLGDTLTEIAGEKAGILKPGIPHLSAPQPEEVASALPATVRYIPSLPETTELGLKGPHQHQNAALAQAALKAANIPHHPEAFATTTWPGRFQKLGNYTLDGAHNPPAAEALAKTWQQTHGNEKTPIIFGAVATKDVQAVLAALKPIASNFIFTIANTPRAQDPKNFTTKIPHTHTKTLKEALSKSDTALITGSLHLVGEAIALLGDTAPYESSSQ